ncbi:hypothetical protein BCR33DRAFT_721737 [Rhizoclosmatium globosum]|uniref:Uncharacterized protein n=1 Tax=Rhizoclosmatium globosum TaxID=329046 RepID=A0A1Y2BQV0_9FUNG|nr:hypothetical protein BCR33DRAFT_721737 [Rhizoclosmatium globosum]|eukprot:ORY37114.1 hypothetical protein BCR33DRAFT_721737 [Rhizoclosmatium globosum]
MGDRLALDWNSQAEQLRSVLEETTSLGFEAKASKSAAALARLDQSKAAAKEMKAENVSSLAEGELLSLSKEVDRIDAAFQDPEQARQQLLQSRRLQQHQHQHFPQAASSSSSHDDNHNSHNHLDTGELVQLQNRMLDGMCLVWDERRTESLGDMEWRSDTECMDYF